MKQEPLVSIITPVYNGESYIQETIESVLNQSYQNWEMIIVNNGSTDSSAQIVNSIDDKRIRLLELDSNSGGPAKPRNIGIDNAKGKYMAFLDADDVWLPLKLEKQITYLEENEDVDICYTLAYIIDQDSKKQHLFNNQRFYNKLKYLISKKNILFYTNYININSVVMKNTKVIKFEEDRNLVALEDWKYWIDNQQDNKNLQLLDEILLHYRVHSNSTSDRGSDKGYRKATYMLSKLLINKQIEVRHYFFSILFHLIKIKSI